MERSDFKPSLLLPYDHVLFLCSQMSSGPASKSTAKADAKADAKMEVDTGVKIKGNRVTSGIRLIDELSKDSVASLSHYFVVPGKYPTSSPRMNQVLASLLWLEKLQA